MQRTMFVFVAAALEVTWLCAWSAYTLDLLFQRTYPLPGAIIVFALGALVAVAQRGTRWRFGRAAAIHTLVLSFFGLQTIHDLWFPTQPASSLGWLLALARESHTLISWVSVAASWGWTLAFWVAGVRFAGRSTEYESVCARFDAALGWMFWLLLSKVLLGTQAGVRFAEPISSALIEPLFLFGLTAVALARNRQGSGKAFTRGNRGFGLAAVFAPTVVVSAAGVALLFAPYLRVATQAGYSGLTQVGGPVASVLAEIVVFILSLLPGLAQKKTYGFGGGSSSEPVLRSLALAGQGAEAAERNKLILNVLAGAIVSVACFIALWYLVRWLRSRTSVARTGEGLWAQLRRWLVYVLNAVRVHVSGVMRERRRHESIRVYRALIAWGSASGVPMRTSDTPLEYASRLKQTWREYETEFDLIVAAVNLHAFGPSLCDPDATARARRALRRLRSPWLWHKRIWRWHKAIQRGCRKDQHHGRRRSDEVGA